MRYFITFSYNGKNYHGWQYQPNAITVQEILEDRVSKLLGSKTAIYGAGRTDTGVHASKMVAHFEGQIEDESQFIYRLNSFLPNDIGIIELRQVEIESHARFDAKKRTYHYNIHYQKNPFIHETSWYWYHNLLDLEAMNEAATYLLTVNDFSSFARLHGDNKTTICDVTEAYWEITETGIKFNITANRFLRNMVRAIVGTLTEVGRGRLNKEDLIKIIAKKDRNFASASAPAHGLFLSDIVYADDIFL